MIKIILNLQIEIISGTFSIFLDLYWLLLGINYIDLFFVFLWLITSSSLINNQILEKDSDGLMKRTKKRPMLKKEYRKN